MKLLIATKNIHKLTEIENILQINNLQLLSIRDFPNLPDVEESGETFFENSALKAVELARFTGLWALADDSGLVVDALDGRPGVYSARFAGDSCDDAANNQKLLKLMKGAQNRSARFVCNIALASPDGICRHVEGSCEGQIANKPNGSGGFGYDPLFIPDGHIISFAELGSEIKNSISHRGRALVEAAREWTELLE